MQTCVLGTIHGVRDQISHTSPLWRRDARPESEESNPNLNSTAALMDDAAGGAEVQNWAACGICDRWRRVVHSVDEAQSFSCACVGRECSARGGPGEGFASTDSRYDGLRARYTQLELLIVELDRKRLCRRR